jgi:hypothetical protein
MKRTSIVILVAAIALGAGCLFSACGGDEVTCAAGTVKEGGKCVPACASNEYFDGEQCQTVCEEGKYWDGTSCLDVPECADGTSFNSTTNRCEPDITGCAPGTHLDGDECVADYLPDPDYPESQTEIPEITLAGEGESISIGGVVETPEDVNEDGWPDADWDEFFFQTTEAGVYLDIHATSEGACLPAFAVYGITPETCNLSPDKWVVFYTRYGLNPNGLDCQREVYLPMAGCYVIMVTDYNNLVEAVFGQGVVPLGGDEFTYYVEITTLPDPVPSAFTNFPASKTGDFAEGKLSFYSISGLSAGEVINGVSMGMPIADTTSHAFPAVMVFGPDGHLMSEVIAEDNLADVEVLFEVAGGEYLLVQDFLMTIGANDEFELNVAAYTPTDCTANDCSSQDLPAGEIDVLTYDVAANEIFFHSAEPASGSLTIYAYDQTGTLLGGSYASAGAPSVILKHMPQAGKIIVKIVEDEGLAATYTQTVLHIAESLLEPGENTGKEVIEFPPYTYYNAGIDQFDGSAGQLAVFTDYTLTNPIDPDPFYPLIEQTDEILLSAVTSAGGLAMPYVAALPYTGRFLHWIHAGTSASFYPNTYSLTMGLVDVTPNVGMPTETVPIQVTTNALDANVDMAALRFTAATGEGYGIIATPPNGSTLLTEVQVFCEGFYDSWFGAFCWAGEPQLVQVHTATAADAGEALDTGFFTAEYDGEYLVAIRDTSGTATGTETYAVTVAKPVCDLDATRCNGDVLEVCDGYGWNEAEVCAEECATIGEEAACVKLISSLPYTDNTPRPPDYAFNYYKMVLPSDATVDIEMTMGDCYGDDTMLYLLDAAGEQIAYHDDVDYPADKCALIEGQAITASTTYFIAAYVYPSSVSANYHLSITAQ